MSNNEIIEWLKKKAETVPMPGARKMYEAAAKALEAQKDMVSRKTANVAICNACGKIDCDQVDKCEKLQLSPANISETPNSSDTISRQQAIDTEGLDEEIRCEMCKNPMHTDRGCDGYCKYDEKLYERIMQILDERIKPLPSAQQEIIRCKDCKHYEYGICKKAGLCVNKSPNGFCDWGDMRGEQDENR